MLICIQFLILIELIVLMRLISYSKDERNLIKCCFQFSISQKYRYIMLSFFLVSNCTFNNNSYAKKQFINVYVNSGYLYQIVTQYMFSKNEVKQIFSGRKTLICDCSQYNQMPQRLLLMCTHISVQSNVSTVVITIFWVI